MADDQGLSAQDIQDLRQIRSQLPAGDPRAAKLDAMLQTIPPNAGLAPPAGSGINPVAESANPLSRYATAFGARAGELNAVTGNVNSGGLQLGRDSSGQIRNATERPPVQAPPSQAFHRMTNGDIAGGLGEGTADAVATALPFVVGALSGGGSSKANLRPGAVGPSESFVSRPAQAEAVANAINVPPNQVKPLITSLTHETGSVLDFAKRTGNPLEGVKDFAQAAQGAAEEAQGIYKNRVIDPIANERIPLPNGYQAQKGITQITIGDLDQRITDLNDELRSNYQKASEGQTREAQARDAEIHEQLDQLRPQLYKEIAARTNLNVAEVQEMRQHFGRLFDIADRSNFAVNEKMRAMLNEMQGQQTSKSLSEAAFRVVNRLRGGPLGQADSMLKDALSNVKMNPYNMPDVQHMNQPISLSMDATPTPSSPYQRGGQ